MKRIVALLASAVFFVAPALAADSDNDRLSLQIEAGRLGVMMGESSDLLPGFDGSGTPAPPDTPKGIRAVTYYSLVYAVLSYNILSWRACHLGVVEGALCLGPYLPAWLNGHGDSYTDAQLRDMTSEASSRLMPFWAALCAKAQKPGADSVCPME